MQKITLEYNVKDIMVNGENIEDRYSNIISEKRMFSVQCDLKTVPVDIITTSNKRLGLKEFVDGQRAKSKMLGKEKHYNDFIITTESGLVVNIWLTAMNTLELESTAMLVVVRVLE